MGQVIIPEVQLAFNSLFTAKVYDDGEPRFYARLLIPKGSAQAKAIQAAVDEVAAEAWKGKAAAMLEEIRGSKQAYCIANGDTKSWDGAEGHWVLSANRRVEDGRPLLLNAQRQPAAAEDGLFRSGCFVNAIVDIYAQTRGKGAPGMRCSLGGLMYHSVGTPFAGASTLKPEDFASLAAGDAPDDFA